MESDTGVCQKCHSEISASAEVCPECQFDPQKNGRLMRKIFFFGGWFLTICIVGAPIGIPMLLAYYIADYQVSQKKPTAN